MTKWWSSLALVLWYVPFPWYYTIWYDRFRAVTLLQVTLMFFPLWFVYVGLRIH